MRLLVMTRTSRWQCLTELSITEEATCYFQDPAWFLIMEGGMFRGICHSTSMRFLSATINGVENTWRSCKSFLILKPHIELWGWDRNPEKYDLSSSAWSPLLLPLEKEYFTIFEDLCWLRWLIFVSWKCLLQKPGAVPNMQVPFYP